MALSPGLETRENSISNFLRAVSTSSAASVGEFEWGPVNSPFVVSDPNSLLEAVHKPTDTRYVDWFSAFNFLSYSSTLWLTRVIDRATAKNSTLVGTAVLADNQATFEALMDGVALTNTVIGRYPGALANNIRVIVVDASTYESLPSKYSGIFSAPPATSSYAKRLNSVNDELHVAVIDEIGYITGNAGAVLESWEFLSKGRDGKSEAGNEAYWANVINRESKFIYVTNAPATTDGGKSVSGITISAGGSAYTYADIEITGTGSGALAVAGITGGVITEIIITEPGTGYTTAPTITVTGDGTGATLTGVLGSAEFDDAFGTTMRGTVGRSYTNLTAVINSQLTGGTNGGKPSVGDYTRGWDNYSDTESFPVQLYYLGSGHSDESRHLVANHVINNIAEARKDCLFAHSPRLTDVKRQTQTQALANIKRFYTLTRSSSSYTTRDTGWKTQYDPYNDIVRWIPLDADMAGLCANTDAVADVWWSPSGYNRGKVKNVIELAWSPNKTSRDVLYTNSINSIIATPNEGVVLIGDRTAQQKETPFSYINVRRLFNMLKTKIGNANKELLFEFNDDFTRNQFINTISPELEKIQNRRGLSHFKIICNRSNNTDAVLDAGEFVGTVLIRPARSINFIRLNFVAVTNSVTFEEASNVQF